MRYLLLTLLAFGLSATACGKKSSSVATAPTTTTTTTTTSTPDCYKNALPAPISNSYYAGFVQITNTSVYANFLMTAFGYTSSGSNSYGVSCTINGNIFWLLSGGKFVDCSTGQSTMTNYVSQQAMVEIHFTDETHVEGRWLVGASQTLQGGITYYEAVPFSGVVTRLTDGRYLVQAGPLAFLTTMSGSKVNFSNLNIYMNQARFGNVTIQ